MPPSLPSKPISAHNFRVLRRKTAGEADGKELQRMHGYDCYDYGARHSQTTLGRFTTQDPMAERYYDISPYALCGGNPVRYVDWDGRKITFATGSTKQFKKDVQTAVNYLYEKGAAKIVDKLIRDPEINLTIKETTDEKIRYRSDNTITWNPKVGVITNNGATLSPTTVLNHEFDHALQANKNHEQFMKDVNDTNQQYKNKEEKRVIENSEQETAKKLGEIKENETTRLDHYAIPIITESPTSNKPKYEY